MPKVESDGRRMKRRPKSEPDMFGIKKLSGEVHQMHREMHGLLASKHDLSVVEKRLSDLIKTGVRPDRVRFDWAVGPVENKKSK